VRQLVDHRDQRLRLLAQRRERDAEEHREDDDLQDLVVGHRLGDRLGNEVADEVLERELGGGEIRRGADVGKRQADVDSRLEQVGEKEPEQSETSDAVMNQPSALPKTRPTEAASPMCAMPTTSVENTSGAMIILMRRRNTSETIET
jgi:hypothetical protein